MGPEPVGKKCLTYFAIWQINEDMKLADYISSKQTTASRLAGEVGVPVSTITRLLRGERRPGIELVARISSATSGAVTAEDFFPAPQEAGAGE